VLKSRDEGSPPDFGCCALGSRASLRARYAGSMPPAFDPDLTLAAFRAAPDPALLSPTVLRLARRLPEVQESLAPLLADPLDRALLGIEPPPAETALDRAVLSGLAAMDGGLDVPGAAELEARALGDLSWWVPAAQVHAACSPAREQAARRTLSEQDLPYVFPGELDAVIVDLLAAGARIVPSLHVDWARKLTELAADALVLDLRALGLWFWPVLRSLPTDRLVRPVTALGRARRLPPGALGLATAYAFRVGAPWAPLLAAGGEADRLLAALAMVGDRAE